MKAQRCLLGAAALPRPPENSDSNLKDITYPRMSEVKASCKGRSRVVVRAAGAGWPITCVWWWVVMVVVLQLQCSNSGVVNGDQLKSGGEGDGDCPVRTDAVDVQAKAYVSAQVVEATVQGDVPQDLPSGQPYTLSFVVSRSLRRYRGPGRIKKQAKLELTFLSPREQGQEEGSDSDEQEEEQCLVEAAIRPRRKYVLFLSSGRPPGEPTAGPDGGDPGLPSDTPRGRAPLTVVPVAAPVPASKKLRRIIKKIACSKCGMVPVVKGLRDDSIVSNQTLVLECSIQGAPLPVVNWYKDGTQLLSADRHKISSTTRTGRNRGRSTRNTRGSNSNRRGGHVTGQVARRRGKRRRGRPPVGTASVASMAEDDEAAMANTPDHETPTNNRTRRRKGNGRKGDRRNSNSSSKRGRGRTRGSKRRGDNNVKGSNSSEPPTENGGGGQRRKQGSRDPSQQPSGGSPTTTVTVVSVLEVSRVTAQDVGLYKCVATNVVGEAHSQAHIRVVKPIEPHPGVKYCDPDHASYCLNGGTCMLYTDFNEYICICPEGYKGHRCQEKEVYPTFADDSNCRGPLRHLRHSHGLRCPRNQPTALWELLHQMHPRKKVSPWTKPHLLDWSPPNTGSSAAIFWPPRFTPPVQHSSKPTHHLHRGTLTAPYPLAPQHKKTQHLASQVPMQNFTSRPTYPIPEQSHVNYYKDTKDIHNLHGSLQNRQRSPIRKPYLSHSHNSHPNLKRQFGTNSLQTTADYDNDGSNKQIPLVEDTKNNRVTDVRSQHFHNNHNKPSHRKYLKLTENGDRQFDVTESSLVVKRVLEKQEEVDDRGKRLLSVSSPAPTHRHQFAHQWTDQ